MRIYLIGVVAGLIGGFGSSAALAQTAPAVDWSGFQVGGGVGAAMSRSHVQTTTAAPSAGGHYLVPNSPDFTQLAASGDGYLAHERPSVGLELGYNRQFGNILFGLVASANSLAIDESRSAGQVYLTLPTDSFTVEQRVKAGWQATLRPKLGWAQDKWLAYVTGGLAVTRATFDATFRDTATFGGVTGARGQSSTSETRLGWTLGLGGEYALDSHWSLTGNYLFADFGKLRTSSVLRHPGYNGSNPLNSIADLNTHTVLLGVAYRFNRL